MKDELQYKVSGRITDSKTGKPVKNLLVRAFDKDFFRNQHLGSNTTDENGYYKIQFTRDEFTGPLIRLERHPDLFVIVYEADNEIYSTKMSIVLDAANDTTIDVSMNYYPVEEVNKNLQNIMGTVVNLKYLPKLTTHDLVDAYKLLRYPKLEAKNLDLILKAFPHLLHKHSIGDDCGEGRGEAIRYFLQERKAEELLSDADDFPSGTSIKSFFTERIEVKYTLDSGNANALTGSFAGIPGSDANFNSPDGASLGTIRTNLADLHTDNTEVAPTYVQKIGLIAEFALTKFITAPFSFIDPRNGAARMEYRVLLQDAGIAGQTAQTWSHVEVDIDNSDSSNFGTIPHEMFHQVQYRYNNAATRTGIYGILREGGARHCEEVIFDTPNRYVSSAGQLSSSRQTGIFTTPEESHLDLGGVSTRIRYAAGLFWKYIAEHHSHLTGAADEPGIGIDTYRILLEETTPTTAGYTIAGLRNARRRMPWYGSFDQFGYYDMARTELSSHENTWGNYLLANFLHGLIRPGDADYDSRFDYKEDEDTASTVLNTLRANIQTSDSIIIGRGENFSRTKSGIKPYAAYYFELLPNTASAPRMVRVDFTTSAGLTDPIIQIVRLGPGNEIIDIHKSDKATFSKTIHMQGLSRLIVIVGSKENEGDFSVNFTEVVSASDVMVTRWNTRVGNEFEVDPKGYAWAWVSPDIMVDTNDDGLEDASVFFGRDNKLKVRLRNRGNGVASNIRIDFWYQKATPYLTTAGWLPVQNLVNVTQEITTGSLTAGEEKWFSVDWCPDDDGSGDRHWCVKVNVTVSGDPNTDNKMAFRNFNNLTAPADGDYNLVRFSGLLRNLKFRIFDDIQLIPRGTHFNFELMNAGEVIKKKEKGTPTSCDCHDNVVMEIPSDLKFGEFKLKKSEKMILWDMKNTQKPNVTEFFYPIDKRTLPPGIDTENLITVTHEINGTIVGGITYWVQLEK